MVVGASGVLGKLVCTELLRIFENHIHLIVTNNKAERGKKLADSFNGDIHFQYLDVNMEENVNQVVKNVDIVIILVRQKMPNIQLSCIENRILCVDVTPFYEFAEKVMELNERAENNHTASVIMSGFFPGLSGLMVKAAVSNFQDVTEVNVGLLQNTNAKAGLSGILDMLTIIAQPVKFQNTVVAGFSKKRSMDFFTIKEKEVRLIYHSETMLLKDNVTAEPINYWTSWNKEAFNKQVSLLRKMGLIGSMHKVNNKLLSMVVKHNLNKNEQAFLTVEVKGIVDNKERIKIFSLSTFSDYHTTAMVTAALAKVVYHKNVKGVVCPFDITNVDELLSIIDCSEIVVEEVVK